MFGKKLQRQVESLMRENEGLRLSLFEARKREAAMASEAHLLRRENVHLLKEIEIANSKNLRTDVRYRDSL